MDSGYALRKYGGGWLEEDAPAEMKKTQNPLASIKKSDLNVEHLGLAGFDSTPTGWFFEAAGDTAMTKSWIPETKRRVNALVSDLAGILQLAQRPKNEVWSRPPLLTQYPFHRQISLPVALDFAPPVCGIRFRLAITPGAAMPKASVNENRQVVRQKNKIRMPL